MKEQNYRILVDLSVFPTLESGGIWNSTVEILSCLLKASANGEAPGYEIVLLVRSSNEKTLKMLFPWCQVFTLPSSEVKDAEGWEPSAYSLRTQLYSNRLSQLRPDVVWLPYATPYNYYRTSAYTVYTVHDLIPLHEAGDDAGLCEKYRAMASAADHIIAVSDFVREDIIHTLHVEPMKAGRIYSPVNIDPGDQEPIPEMAGKRFILELNAYERRKNKQTVLRAFQKIRKKHDVDLVMCGAYTEETVLKQLMLDAFWMGLTPHVHFYRNLSVAQRNWLLTNASLLVSASVMEGFGRTPVEAAMCCVPVVIAKADPLPEATMGLVCEYEHPFDDAELAEKITSLLDCPPERVKLMEIREKLTEKYSGDHAARAYLKVFCTNGASANGEHC